MEHALNLAVVFAAMLGGVNGFPVVEHEPGAHLHGRHRAARHRRRPGLTGPLTAHTPLLWPMVGFLFVLETLSVMLHVIRPRLTGERLFRRAPIRHHFELGGRPETTVTIRFWIMGCLATAMALGMFHPDYIRIEGLY